ncbi:MAG: hypothetical protein HY827_06005 [Actinobacteria bacterium]|nr:hypothetical protein [Actinomycetota bacterium]
MTNRPVGLVLGLVASLVVANIVLRKEFARLAAIDPAELRVAPKTSRLGYMSRSETAIAVVALVLVGGFSTMHPLGQNRGWIGGGTNADVRVKGVPMRKAHFINGFIDNGFLHLTITKVKPEGVDPRLIYVGTEFADDAIDFRRTVPFHPVRTERSISASFFLNFGVRGCTAGSPAGSALRSVQPFKKVVIEYTVGGRRHSMTFAGARSATPAGFDLCK